MIRTFTTLISFLLISSSWGLLTKIEFENFIESICLKTDENGEPFNYINGQENPLASTLENFIALAEKFELANPHKELKDELFYFIRYFTYNNFEYTPSGDVARWTPRDSNFKEIDDMWEQDENLRKSLPQVEDPFTEAEKCSLFFMISHSIIRSSRKAGQQRSNVMILNGTSNNKWGSDFVYNNDDLYPLEHGVISIMGTNDGVELGRLLTGMYVGLKKDRMIPINTYREIPPDMSQKLTESRLDPLYILTIAEVITTAFWRGEFEKRDLFANDSYWISAPIGSDIDPSVCPVVLRLKPDNVKSAYSYSSLRGAADGLILGKVSGAIESRKRDAKLSQILRQYYSRGGFVEKTDDGLGEIRASFCNRESLLSNWEKMTQEQIHLFLLLASTSYKKIDTDFPNTWNKYMTYKGLGVFRNNNTVTESYCKATITDENPENLSLETPLDVIVVLDTDNNDEANFNKQQWIIGSLAKRLQLSYGGSRMTVFTDQRVYPPSSQSDKTVDLREILDGTYSQACAACYVTQASIGTFTRHPEQHVILGVNQYLTQKKENETKYNGVNGKVLILFNFDEEMPRRPSADQNAVIKALEDLRLNHRDVSMYALGKNAQILKRYARNDPAFVLPVFDERTDDAIADELYKKMIAAPAKLQYPDCSEARSEKNAVFEGFITPNSIQHWAMPAEYFHKSFKLKFTFEAFYGKVKVCQSRSTESPELQKVSCQEISSGSPLSVEHSNPCEGYTKHTCAPFYFSLIGINTTDGTDTDYCDDKTTENKCMRLDQIKFKISHEGIRCSGSMALMAAPLSLLFAFIVSHLFSKLA